MSHARTRHRPQVVPRRRLPRPRSTPGALPVYSGGFAAEQAERLLWRAGFGPRRGEAAKLARHGLRAAVLSLTRPSSRALHGPAPTLQNGEPIAPYDAWGHDVLWWLRLIQGIGLGGAIPLMAAYVNEFARAQGRGRFSISIQVLFSIGLVTVALVSVYVVPHWGWQWMFIIGADAGSPVRGAITRRIAH